MTSSSESEEDSDEETEQLSKEKFSERGEMTHSNVSEINEVLISENERIVECELPDSTTNPILASKSASPDSTEASFIQPT